MLDSGRNQKEAVDAGLPNAGAYSEFTAELKAKWLEALRSGKYQQGQYELWTEEEGTHCCLGVLICEAKNCTSPYRGGSYVFVDSLIGGATSNALQQMNDLGSTFPEIADYIEANVPAVDEQPRSETQTSERNAQEESSTNKQAGSHQQKDDSETTQGGTV